MGRRLKDPSISNMRSNEDPETLSEQYPDLIWAPYANHNFAIAFKKWEYDRRSKEYGYVYHALDGLGPIKGDDILSTGLAFSRDKANADILYASLNPIASFKAIEIHAKYNEKFRRKIKSIPKALWAYNDRAWAVPEEFRERAVQLAIECYGTPNAFSVTEGHTVVLRSKENVLNLIHCYSDYDDVDSPTEAFREIRSKLENAGVLLPNVFHDSGTGVWVVYNLFPVLATIENIVKWDLFQHFLASVLGNNVDGNVISDTSRTCRIAGSRNNKNGRIVADYPGAPGFYNLDELVACVPEDFTFTAPSNKNLSKVKAIEKQKAMLDADETKAQAVLSDIATTKKEKRLATKRLEEIREERQKLEVPSGLIPHIKNPVLRRYYHWVLYDLVLFCDFEGAGREKHIWGLRYFLRRAGYTEEAALNMVLMVNSILENPLKEAEIHAYTASADYKECYNFSKQGIIRFFEISEEAMPYIGMSSDDEIKQKELARKKAYYEDKRASKGKLSKDEYINIELDKIEELLGEGKSQKEICKALGIKKSTVSNRVKAIKKRRAKGYSKKFSAFFIEKGAEERGEGGQDGTATPSPDRPCLTPLLLTVEDVLSDINNVPMYRTSSAVLNPDVKFQVDRLLSQELTISTYLTLEKVHEILIDDGLDEAQEKAIYECLSHGITALIGKWGTGKSTIIKGLIKVFKTLYPDKNVAVMAPTGTAAQNIADKTGEDARTIHSKLHIKVDDDMDANDDAESYAANFKNALVVVDEASMVDDRLMKTLLQRCDAESNGPWWHSPGCQVILVGDPHQLEAVEDGAPFRALVEQRAIPVVELVKEYRTATDSYAIDAFASAVRGVDETGTFVWNDFESGHGLDILAYSNATSKQLIERELVERAVANAQQYGITNSIVLCPKNRYSCGVIPVNQLLQAILNKNEGEAFKAKHDLTIRKGDPVMNLTNRRLGKGKARLANGSMGVCVDVQNGTATCEFMVAGKKVTHTYTERDAKSVTLAYAVSIHKSQGHEWDAVAFSILEHQKHSLSRRLLCTALTRAKKSATFLCNAGGIRGAIQGLADKGDVA